MNIVLDDKSIFNDGDRTWFVSPQGTEVHACVWVSDDDEREPSRVFFARVAPFGDTGRIVACEIGGEWFALRHFEPEAVLDAVANVIVLFECGDYELARELMREAFARPAFWVLP